MTKSGKFIKFLNTLQTSENAKLLESVKQGFRAVVESEEHPDEMSRRLHQAVLDKLNKGIPLAGKDCKICRKPVNHDDFTDEISRKEWKISGLCQKCQDNVFGEPEDTDLEKMTKEEAESMERLMNERKIEEENERKLEEGFMKVSDRLRNRGVL